MGIVNFTATSLPSIWSYGYLYGLTPKEVFEGKVPDKNMYINEKKKAAKQRLEYNRRCTDCIT